MAPGSIPTACLRAGFGLRAALVALCLVAAPFLAAAQQGAQSAGTALWERLQRAAWVVQGAKRPAHLIYVIADANCPYCHDLWLSLRPRYAQGLQVRYVMVGILTGDSPGKAAAIIEARNPSLALDQNETQWARLPDDLGGGIPPLQTPKPATMAALRANEQLMHDLGVHGTPALIYRSADHVLHVLRSASDPAKLKTIVDAAAPN